ncbi:MAG: 5-oxoprolinase subunit PxpB [Gemmatimonadaceae bacterium]|nr:5-oxoprolinase subunit PxpB [Gemmatimonadaceae bacterium]
MPQTSVIPLGDRALTLEVPEADGAASRDLIRCLQAQLRCDAPAAVTALVPAIRTLTVHYDPMRITFGALRDYLAATVDALVVTAEPPRQPVIIPVCYGGEFGPDLDQLASLHGTSADGIVATHTAGAYIVAMVGFLPGFPYLEGLDPSLHTPRRAEPRTAVPAGSVGIGGSNTGIYPFSSPGGWHLIGRTPRTLFAATRDAPSLLLAGDHVRFTAITPTAFREQRERPA